MLKPGQYFALDELCLTDKFDPNNPKHRDLKAKIELGSGLPDVRSTRQCIQAMKEAGLRYGAVLKPLGYGFTVRQILVNYFRIAK